MFAIETVAVMGASDAGTAFAVLASLAGCAVRLHAASPEALDGAFESVRLRVERALEAGAITGPERQRILDGVLFTPDLEEAVTAADLVVDAGGAAEHLARLAELLRVTAAVAAAGETPPERLAAGVPQPGRVLALRIEDAHGPVPRLAVTAAGATTEHVLAQAAAFAERVNRAARPGGSR